MDSKLSEIGFKTQLIVVFCTREFRVFLFGPPNNTYSSSCSMVAGVSQTVEVIEEAARKYIKESTRSNADVKIVRVVEVFVLKLPLVLCLTILKQKTASLEQYKEQPRLLDEHDCILRNAATPLRDISAEYLIIEFGS